MVTAKAEPRAGEGGRGRAEESRLLNSPIRRATEDDPRTESGQNGRRVAQAAIPRRFAITRQADTELAYSGEYWNLHEEGLYRCICCDNALFTSDTKFDSGTGWPSYWSPIAPENVRTTRDTSLGMVRTSVSCTECDAHLGHVFDDGPEPTGLRYCMNSASLRFVARQQQQNLTSERGHQRIAIEKERRVGMNNTLRQVANPKEHCTRFRQPC